MTKKKYTPKPKVGVECLNCTLPESVCCGAPTRCKIKYEKQLAKIEAAEIKKNTPRTRGGRNEESKHGE